MEFLMSIIKTVGGKGWMEIGSVSYIFGWISDHAIFIIPLIVFIVVQLIKFVAHSMKNGWSLKNALMYGHMPSAHSAIVVSTAISAAMFDPNHFRSGAFALSVIFVLIVIGDALNLRMHISDQARYLNMFAERLNTLSRKMDMKEEKLPHLNERVGHRFDEVVVGAILGVFLTLIFAWILR